MRNLRPSVQTAYTFFSASQSASGCRSDGSASAVTTLAGTLSSSASSELDCHPQSSSWLIEGSAGQRVNLTLMDFGASPSSDDSPSHTSQCIPYGFLLEKTLGVNQTICGGRSRERVLYTSATNSVEVVLLPSRSDRPAFLVKYQGRMHSPSLDSPIRIM